jgi:thiamine-phosphate pyrophosphorylase
VAAQRALFELLLITDPTAPLGLIGSVRAALAGIPSSDAQRVAVQLRAKNLPRQALADAAHELRALTRNAGVRLLINRDIELARTSCADGVHLPEAAPSPSAARAQLGAAALIGASCHDPAGLTRAAEGGASYATLSPVFDSPGKGAPLGRTRFAEWTRAALLPVFALGGVNAASAAGLKRDGASGIAVIGAVFATAEPACAVRELLDAWK